MELYIYRVMFVGCTVDKHGISYIEKADMDGANAKMFVISDLRYPCGITVDHGTDRVYWTDSKLFKIESIRLDGTDRRVSVFFSLSLCLFLCFLRSTHFRVANKALNRVYSHDVCANINRSCKGTWWRVRFP